MATVNDEPGPEPQVLFRLGKKRKPYRHRTEDPEGTINDSETATETATAASNSAQAAPRDLGENKDEDEDEGGFSVATVLRLRGSRKHKHGGVGFRAGPSPRVDEDTEQSLVLRDSTEAQLGPESALVGGTTKRFAPQTGLAGEIVNKHMEKYVESELARRKRHAAEAAAQQQQQQWRRENSTPSTADLQSDPTSAPAGGQADSQRVLQGRLLEIDLGEEARARNVEMTERARRRLQGQIDDEEQDESKGQPRKPRLGREGKPLRQRNRRGSDDIRRDQLVEEFLSENRLDVYDMPSEQAPNVAGPVGDDAAADDRIAEEFRRDFMEAMAQRNRRRRPAQNAKAGVKKQQQEEILKGPKLGGSRNARAAMRDLLLKEQASKRK